MISLAPKNVRGVFRESAGFLAGGTAALLQTAHPYVAKGIIDHSDVLENPHLRFQRTFFYIFRISKRGSFSFFFFRSLSLFTQIFFLFTALLFFEAFGDLPTVVKSARAVRNIHNKIHGTLAQGPEGYSEGEAYAAHDHEAVKWVYATLLETNMFLNALIVRRLSHKDRDDTFTYFREGSVVFGLRTEDFPSGVDEFDQYYFAMCYSPALTVTPEAQKICDALMKPLLWEKYIPFVNTLKTVTGVLMPEPVAKQYGFSVGLG